MNQPKGISRRRVLKSAAAGAAAFHIVPARALAAGADGRLNIALLGSGNRTRQLLPSILRAGENVVAACDVDPSQIARLKKTPGTQPGTEAGSLDNIKVYEDYRKLLESEKSVDAVVIASGQRWHVPMSKAALLAGKHVFCEKPMAHSVLETRDIAQAARQNPKLATQLGTQGGTSDTFRRCMEIIQAGLLGRIAEVHCWINRTFPPSAPIDRNADPVPEGLNWDFWCGPSPLLPFKTYYLGGCLKWGRWLDFGDGHLADMGAHALNLPCRALKLGPPQKASVNTAEPVRDSYPSATTFRWDFAAREGFGPVTVYWHDGPNAGPPEELSKDILSTYRKVPGNGVLFAGEKGFILSDAWGRGGVMRLKGEAKGRGVLDHEAAAPLKVVEPRMKGQDHMQEWLDACRGKLATFQPFTIAAPIAEIAMVGMVSLRLGRPIAWDSASMKAPGAPEADKWIRLEQRRKWL